jgi:two-component system chemotaxis response regulator CheY
MNQEDDLTRILAIDDSQVILSLIKDILTSHDYIVETVSDGQEALEKYTEFKPDLVTLDLTMPLMDGYQVLRRLKAIDKHCTVIMISASEHSSALQDCLKTGAAGFLSKPFKPKELIDVIEKSSRGAGNPDKNIVSLFSLVADKIQNIMAGMYPSSGASVTLEDVRVRHNVIDDSQRNVDEYNAETENDSATRLSPKMMLPSDDQVSFLTEIHGQAVGMIITMLRKSDLDLLFGHNGGSRESVNDKAKEFFNILNTKVLSQLADATHLKIDTKPTMYMGRPNDRVQFWNSTSNLWDQIVKASYKLNFDGHVIPLDIQLWYDGGPVFS